MGPGDGVSEELILGVIKLLIAAVLGAVGGAYAAGRQSSDTRHTLRGEMSTATVTAAVAFGRLEERVAAAERAITANHASAFGEIRRVEDSLTRELRIINRKLDTLMAGSAAAMRRSADEDDGSQT